MCPKPLIKELCKDILWTTAAKMEFKMAVLMVSVMMVEWAGVIVLLPPDRVTQNFIGIFNFLKLLFITTTVWMVLHGQLSVGLFDFFFGGVFIYAQYLI
jgi:hypothetical protein